MPRALRLALAGVASLLAACQVQTEVALTVDEDGSGTVEVVVGLDAEAVDRVGDPARLFETDDLVDSGWAVSSPAVDEEGLTRVRATRSFGSPAEAGKLLTQVAGDSGLFDGVTLTRTDSFTTTTYTFRGVADLSQGLTAFSDDDLVAALDGEPLGESVAAIEERFGAPVDEMFSMAVVVELPGEPPTTTEWEPVLGGAPVTMVATSEITDRTPLVLLAVAAAAGLTAIGITGWRLLRRNRRPADEAVSPPA